MFRALLTTVSAVAVVTAVSASAGEYGSVGNGEITIQQSASMMAYDAGNDRARVSIAPNWSDELGWSVRASAGSYMGDAVALGVIVEYGKDKQEYLANLGFQITDAMSLIGTVGNLAETKEFIAGSGKDKASQMEYGLSLKQSMQDGMGFEINGYGVNARASNASIETGKLYGAEGLLTLGLAYSTMIKLGGGYEWLKWETTGEKNDHWSGRAEINQRLTDNLSLQGEAKLGASERSYGGGLSLNVTDNSLLGFHYTQIEGRNGIADDKRAEVSFTLGFGGSSTNTAAVDSSTPDQTIKAASLATSASHNSLLLDVMKRPGYLPKRVLAREGQSGAVCEIGSFVPTDDNSFENTGLSTLADGVYTVISISGNSGATPIALTVAGSSAILSVNAWIEDDFFDNGFVTLEISRDGVCYTLTIGGLN
jgi:hypothetical protein